MGFFLSGSDISDTCWRHFNLHESYTYYIAPTCRLPRDTSSSVRGSNSKLRLPVTWHRATVIIYGHRTVVLRPRGHSVHLWQFRFYDARRVEALLKPSDANLTKEVSFQWKIHADRIGCRGMRLGLLADGFREVYPQTQEKKTKTRSSRRNRPSF